MIVVEQLVKHYGPVQALRGASFSAQDGRITGLLGANGAGKSTTLRIVSTMLRADSGSVRVDHIDGAQDPMAVRQRLGVLPHASGLYPNLTARENILYFGALNGLEAEAIEQRIADWTARGGWLR